MFVCAIGKELLTLFIYGGYIFGRKNFSEVKNNIAWPSLPLPHIFYYNILMKLDYNIKNIKERQELVNKILEENPHPSQKYLEILADYLVNCMDKDEKKEKKILTENRMATVNKRETSYEGLVVRFENGEDGVYNILSDERNIIFRPKDPITEKNKQDIPELAQATESIEYWTEVLKTAQGKDKWIAKNALISARREQYAIRSSRQPTMGKSQKPGQQPRVPYQLKLDGYITFDENGYCVSHGVTLVDPKVCSAIMCNYNSLRSACEYKPGSDLWNLLEEFDKVTEEALADYPMYKTLMDCKIAECQNSEIQKILLDKYGTTHSLEYISSLWRKKIPDIIASKAEDDYLIWYYTEVEYGKWKRCSRCGEVKLAHNKYFSKNSTSKDNFYSICKCCRNKKEANKNGGN